MGFFYRRWLPCGKGCHLITLRLDTALIDDVGRTRVVGGVVQAPQAPAGAAGESWLHASRGGLAPCWARLPGDGGSFLVYILFSDPSLVFLAYIQALQISWAFNPCLALVLSVHESGENACPCIFSPTYAPGPEPYVSRGTLG